MTLSNLNSIAAAFNTALWIALGLYLLSLWVESVCWLVAAFRRRKADQAWRRCDGCDGAECPGGCAADQPRDESSDEFEGTN